MSDASEDAPDALKMTFWEHTRELGRRLKIILYSVFLLTALMMILPANLDFIKNPLEFYDPLIGVILKTVKNQVLPPTVTLVGIEFTAPIELYFIGSMVLGVALSIPVVAYEIYKFIGPALYPHERKSIYPFVTSFTILFVVGAAFGYFVLAPFLIWAMVPFFGVVGAAQFISVLDFYNIVFITVLFTGFSFTLPIYFILLVKFNIINTAIVTKNRLYIYAALYIVCAVMTPDGGPLGDLILFLPMMALLELAVLVGKRYEKGRTSEPRFRIFQSKICRFCGKNTSIDTLFCENCGKSPS